MVPLTNVRQIPNLGHGYPGIYCTVILHLLDFLSLHNDAFFLPTRYVRMQIVQPVVSNIRQGISCSRHRKCKSQTLVKTAGNHQSDQPAHCIYVLETLGNCDGRIDGCDQAGQGRYKSKKEPEDCSQFAPPVNQ